MIVSPSRFRKPPAGARINSAHPLAFGLIAAYFFNEGAGSTLIDSSPYDARPSSTGLTWGADGASFDGSTSYVDLSNPSRLGITYPLTLECIFVLSNATNGVYQRLISSLAGGSSAGFELIFGSPTDGGPVTSRIYIQGANGGTLSYCTGSVITVGQEYHVVATWDGSAPVIYVNGAVATATISNFSSTTAIASSSANVNIGRLSGGGQNWNGRIKKAAIYNRALSAGEVAHLYTDPYAYIHSQRRLFWSLSELTLTGIASEEAWGTAALYRQNELYPLGIPSEEAWGTASLAQTVTLGLTGIASAEAWGTASLVDPNATQTITLTGIASAEAWGSNTITRGGTQTLVATGIPSEEAWGLASLSVAGATYQGIKIYLDGTEYPDLDLNSVKINQKLGARGDASFDLTRRTQSGRPQKLQYVLITENYRRLFAGFIDKIRHKMEENTKHVFGCQASDLVSILDKRLVTAEYAAGATRAIVLDIIANSLNGEHLTANRVLTNTSITQPVKFNNESVSSAFTKISAITGDVWWVSPYHDILFATPGQLASPYTLDETNASVTFRDLVVTENAKNYANSVTGISDANV